MAYVALAGKTLGDKAETAAEIVTQLLSMGWSLYDDMSGSYYKILRTNGESGAKPWLYLKVDWSGTNVTLTGYCAWNATTHSTTAVAAAIHSTIAPSRNLWMYGNKDWFFLAQDSSGTVSVTCMFGHVSTLPADAINTTTTSAISAGSSVVIPVSSSTGFAAGARYQIVDPASGYRQSFTCTGVASGQITADSIASVGYGSGSLVGTHPFVSFYSASLPTFYCLNAHRHLYNTAMTTNGTIDITETSDARTYRGLSLPYLGFAEKRRFYPPIMTEYGASPSSYRYDGTLDDGNGLIYVCPPLNSTTYGDAFTGASLDALYLGQSDSGSTTGSNTVTTLNDTSKSWSVNALAGKVLVMTSGTEGGQIRKIVSNTATQITVAPDFKVIPVSGSYVITDYAYRYFLATQGYLFREGV